MKKILSLLMATTVAVSLAAPVFADSASLDKAYDTDGEVSDDVPNGVDGWVGLDQLNLNDTGSIDIDPARPGSTFYVPLTTDGDNQLADNQVYISDVVDSDYFKFDVDKDDNGSMVSSISLVTERSLNGMDRTHYLKFVLADSYDTDEAKTTGTITFTARDDLINEEDADSYVDDDSHCYWEDDDVITIDYTIWISNEEVEGSDGDADTGDSVYFTPESNEDNVMVWGDDRAALEFEADDDADSFYARLSTKSISTIYAEYGDPVGADLWFYDFVGNPTIPSTSRATLTLGIPWDEDDDYYPNPEDCYIYELDADGYLTDVTGQFTYSEGDQEIDGWSIKTRQLLTYIVSDMELDVDVAGDEEVYDEVDSDTDDTTDITVDDGSKEIPNTGSGDAVNLAVTGGVLSLAVAGAVAFRKSGK